jgi:ABC transporter substrate binding protein
MRRREFITLIGGAVAGPLTARAQQAAMPVVGFLGVSSVAKTGGGVLLDFKRGLAETGFVEDRNVAIEYRWADDHYDRLPALAAELVQRQIAVLAAPGSPAALPAKAATSVIPIVFMIGSDPVKFGLVSSLNHPGGNLTGVSYFNEEIAPKRLNLLHELIPTAKTIALLVNPANVTAEDDDEIHPRLSNGGRTHFEMDEAFCARMRAAIEAGLERAPIGVVSTPGTKNPKYVPAEPFPLPSSQRAVEHA